MTRLAAILAGMLAAGAIAVCAPAAADPDDHVPYCSGDQTPMNSNCRVAPVQVANGPEFGTNPDVPLGTSSGEALMPGQNQSAS